jgi:hypothetical protein
MSRPSSIKIINHLGAKIFETNIAESLYNVNLSIRNGTSLHDTHKTKSYQSHEKINCLTF